MNLDEVLHVLVTSEYDAGAVYDAIASQNEGDVARTSLVFAEQERRHAEQVKILMVQAGDLSQPVGEEVEKRLGLYVEVDDPKKDIGTATRKQLFRHALQMEKNSIALYQEISGMFEPETLGRKHFNALITEEQVHMYFVLKQLHDLE